MGLKYEIDYGKAKVSVDKGEIEDYNGVMLQNVIRRREIELIKSTFQLVKPERILDLGCGGGWLSKVLSSYHYEVVGIDISVHLIKHARKVVPNPIFVLGDSSNLPFREGTFDAVVGIAVLHHVDVKMSLKEIKRVLKNGGTLMLLEPNKLNPLSAFGRKLFPMETHTKGEEPFTPTQLMSYLERQGFKISLIRFLFFFSFPLARMLKLLNRPLTRFLVYIIDIVEKMFECLPVLNFLNSTIVILAKQP